MWRFRPIRIGWLCAALACCSMSGGHWAVLQTIAWGRMAVRYSSEFGLAEGLGKTFDGKHPCGMCTTIQEATADADAEEGSAPAPPSFRTPLLAVASAPMRLFPPHHAGVDHPDVDPRFRLRFRERPPLPPPRRADA